MHALVENQSTQQYRTWEDAIIWPEKPNVWLPGQKIKLVRRHSALQQLGLKNPDRFWIAYFEGDATTAAAILCPISGRDERKVAYCEFTPEKNSWGVRYPSAAHFVRDLHLFVPGQHVHDGMDVYLTKSPYQTLRNIDRGHFTAAIMGQQPSEKQIDQIAHYVSWYKGGLKFLEEPEARDNTPAILKLLANRGLECDVLELSD